MSINNRRGCTKYWLLGAITGAAAVAALTIKNKKDNILSCK